MTSQIKDIIFKPEAGYPINAVVLIFDLGGFSKFFAQPDVQQYVPKYLNKIFSCMSNIIYGGSQWWVKAGSSLCSIQPPIHQKFLGDGALYI